MTEKFLAEKFPAATARRIFLSQIFLSNGSIGLGPSPNQGRLAGLQIPSGNAQLPGRIYKIMGTKSWGPAAA